MGIAVADRHATRADEPARHARSHRTRWFREDYGVGSEAFYGADQAGIHHDAFGDLSERAAERLLAELHDAGRRDGTVVDLGCGSGILARRVSDAGYAVHGVDISPDMVDLARRYAPRGTFHCGSVLDAVFPPAVAVTAIGEVLNYAADDRAGPATLPHLVQRVRDCLAPGGVFLFDVATRGRHGSGRVAERLHERPAWTLRMRAEENEDGTRLDRFITISKPGSDEVIEEHHVLRLYQPDDLRALLTRAGFGVQVLPTYGEPSPSTPPAGWVVVLARAGPPPH
jgi:SAM-dependent methyltransferase